jgi:hypothetical protein
MSRVRFKLGALALTIALAAAGCGDSSSPPPPAPTPAPDVAPAPYKKGRTGDLAARAAADAAASPELHGASLRGPDDQPVGSGAPASGRLAPWPGCGRHPVPSFSARTASVRGIGLHITVSRNVAGRADMDAVTHMAMDPANGRSWHFLIDTEGHCYYSVPIAAKAWTIAALNSQTVNLEIISFGDERGWYAGGGRGFAKVRRVVRRVAGIFSIPLRHGATDGHCNVTRTGIIAHWEGGACAGGHNDIRPWNIVRVVRRIAAG